MGPLMVADGWYLMAAAAEGVDHCTSNRVQSAVVRWRVW